MPPKSIKGKERLAIEQKPKPSVRWTQVPQLEAPMQRLQLQAPKPAPLVTSKRDQRTMDLRGKVYNILSKLHREQKISDGKWKKYKNAIKMIFDEYNFSPSYINLNYYDIVRRCMTDVDNYLFKHEPKLFENPFTDSDRAHQVIEHEAVQIPHSVIPMPQSTALEVLQPMEITHEPIAQTSTELTTVRDTWYEVLIRGLRIQVEKEIISEEEATNIFTQLKNVIDSMNDAELRNIRYIRQLYDQIFLNVIRSPHRPATRYAIKQHPSMDLDTKTILGKRKELPSSEKPTKFETLPIYSQRKRKLALKIPNLMFQPSTAPPDVENSILEPRKRPHREGIDQQTHIPIHIRQKMNLEYQAVTPKEDKYVYEKGLRLYENKQDQSRNQIIPQLPQSAPNNRTISEYERTIQPQQTPNISRSAFTQYATYVPPHFNPTRHDIEQIIPSRIPKHIGYIAPKQKPIGHEIIPFSEPREEEYRVPRHAGFIQPHYNPTRHAPPIPQPIYPQPQMQPNIETTQTQTLNPYNNYLFLEKNKDKRVIQPISQEKLEDLIKVKKSIRNVKILPSNRYIRKPHIVRSR